MSLVTITPSKQLELDLREFFGTNFKSAFIIERSAEYNDYKFTTVKRVKPFSHGNFIKFTIKCLYSPNYAFNVITTASGRFEVETDSSSHWLYWVRYLLVKFLLDKKYTFVGLHTNYTEDLSTYYKWLKYRLEFKNEKILEEIKRLPTVLQAFEPLALLL